MRRIPGVLTLPAKDQADIWKAGGPRAVAARVWREENA